MHRVVKGEAYQKRIEKRTVSSGGEIKVSFVDFGEKSSKVDQRSRNIPCEGAFVRSTSGANSS